MTSIIEYSDSFEDEFERDIEHPIITLYAQDNLLDHIIEEIGLTSPTAIKNFKEAVYSAAYYFEITQESHLKSQTPPHEQEKLLKEFQKTIQKTQKAFANIRKSTPTFYRITEANTQAYDALKQENEQLQRILLRHEKGTQKAMETYSKIERNNITCDLAHSANPSLQYFSYLQKLKLNLDYMERITQNALCIVPQNLAARNKSYPIYQWIKNLDDFWINNIDITFTEGNYNTPDFTSKAVKILKKLMEPLDKNVTEQQIAAAVKRAREERNKK